MLNVITNDGKELKVTFAHVRTIKEDDEPARFSAITFCYIVNGKGILHTGQAWCSSLDQFNRKRGRELSLARAVCGLDKDTRTQIWNKYWATMGQACRVH